MLDLRTGVYIASKAKYGSEWIAMREQGYPVSSSWINEYQPGATDNWRKLWANCITEAATSAALVLVCRPGDILKGAWAEAGAALGAGVPVFAVGIQEFSIRHHPGVRPCFDEQHAFAWALRIAQAQEHAGL